MELPNTMPELNAAYTKVCAEIGQMISNKRAMDMAFQHDYESKLKWVDQIKLKGDELVKAQQAQQTTEGEPNYDASGDTVG